MKSHPVLIDSPNSDAKNHPPKIYGSLCGTKPRSKPKDFDDFFEESTTNQSHISAENLTRLEQINQSFTMDEEPHPQDLNKYTLLEDIRILLIKNTGMSHEKLLPLRSVSSLRSRYSKRLKLLSNETIKEILKYIDENGVAGKTLMFAKNGGFHGIKDENQSTMMILDEGEFEQRSFSKSKEKKNNTSEKLSNPSKNDKSKEKILPKQSKVQRKDDGHEKNLINEEIQDNDKELIDMEFDEEKEHIAEETNLIKNNNFIEAEEENVDDNIPASKTENFKEDKIPIEEEYDETNPQYEPSNQNSLNACCRALAILINLNNTKTLPIFLLKDSEPKLSPLGMEKITVIKDFSSGNREFIKGVSSEAVRILMDLKSVFKRNVRVIIQDLQKVSGNIDDLIEYYTDEERKDEVLWTEEDDGALEEAKSAKENSLKILIKYKGIERVRARLKFKGIKKNFEL